MGVFGAERKEGRKQGSVPVLFVSVMGGIIINSPLRGPGFPNPAVREACQGFSGGGLLPMQACCTTPRPFAANFSRV